MANQDESFIREVNEEIRSEQMRAIWNRFGRIMIAAGVLVVVGTIGKVAYDHWSATKASESGDRFLAALTLVGQNNDEALAALSALESDGHGAYPVLARMRAASLVAERGDAAGAIAAFGAIARDTSVPQALRDAARLRAGYLLVDTGSYDDVSAEVEQLASSQNALRHSAREVLGLSAYKHGDLARAKEWFEQIVADAEGPRNVANRAQMLLDLINANGNIS